jgi:type I restriction enzyme, S subunit
MTWPMKPLSELCELAIDCVNKTAPVVEGPTPYKMIRTTNVKGGFIDTETVRYVTKDTFEKWTRRSRPQYGDVILTREAPVGEVGRCTFDDSQNIFLGQRLFQYRPKPELLNWNYLAYALQSPVVQNKLHGVSFGATVPHVKVGDAENLEIPCPELGVQEYVGETLAAYDDLIENNQRRIALLEESARLLFREWFVNLRFPGSESIPVTDGIPNGWHAGVFGDFVEAVGGATPDTKRADYWDGDIVWLTPTDVTRNDCLFLPDSERKITASGYESCSAKLLPPGTIFMTSRASIGYFALLDKPACTNQGFIAVVPKIDDSRNFLLFHLMDRVEEFEAVATGATFKELSKKKFKVLRTVIPDAITLSAFSEKTQPILDLVTALKKQNINLIESRNALLPKLMSGEIQV